MTVDGVKREVAVANRILWATGQCAGITTSLDHASRRVPDQPDRFVVEGRGYKMDALAAMLPEDMVTSLPSAFLEEVRTRGPMNDLPHFREPFARAKGQPRVGGVWQYYTAEVSRDL